MHFSTRVLGLDLPSQFCSSAFANFGNHHSRLEIGFTDGSGPVAAFENLFIFPRIGWFGLLNGVSTSSLDVEAESSLVRGRIAHVRRRRTCATKVLGTSPSSTAFPRRLPSPRLDRTSTPPAPSVSALEPLPRTNMTRLVGAFVLLLALSCASPVAGQAASAQGGMYYGPFRGPLYG